MHSLIISGAVGASALVVLTLAQPLPNPAPKRDALVVGIALAALAGAVAGVALYVLATTGLLTVMAFALIGSVLGFGGSKHDGGGVVVGALVGAALGAYCAYAPGPDAVAVINGQFVPIYQL